MDEHPFAAVVCHGPVCGHTRARTVVDGLRDSIRRHRHAVLVSAGCVLGPIQCHASAVTGCRCGPVLVIQDCTEERVPQGPAIWVGPVTDDDDLTAVRRWLDSGHPRTGQLPSRLHFNHTPQRSAVHN